MYIDQHTVREARTFGWLITKAQMFKFGANTAWVESRERDWASDWSVGCVKTTETSFLYCFPTNIYMYSECLYVHE
jgi:hypothetical protein